MFSTLKFFQIYGIWLVTFTDMELGVYGIAVCTVPLSVVHIFITVVMNVPLELDKINPWTLHVFNYHFKSSRTVGQLFPRVKVFNRSSK